MNLQNLSTYVKNDYFLLIFAEDFYKMAENMKEDDLQTKISDSNLKNMQEEKQ